MSALANKTSTKRRLLLASDRSDQSSELASILQSVSEVDTISTSDIPDVPARNLSGIVVDINLRSAESVQRVRNKLRGEAYRALPRLFVLAVGISAYDKESLRKGVYYCAADARKFADLVEQSSKPLYRAVKVFRLLDQEATRTKLLQTLGQIRKQATQRDVDRLHASGPARVPEADRGDGERHERHAHAAVDRPEGLHVMSRDPRPEVGDHQRHVTQHRQHEQRREQPHEAEADPGEGIVAPLLDQRATRARPAQAERHHGRRDQQHGEVGALSVRQPAQLATFFDLGLGQCGEHVVAGIGADVPLPPR